MKDMRKLLTIIMATVMLVAMIPMSTGVAFAATPTEVDFGSTPWSYVSAGGIGFFISESDFVNITMPTTDDYYTYGTNELQTGSNVKDLPESGWTWAVQKKDTNGCDYTMILNNFNISSTNITDDALMFKCNLNLVIEGTNVINAPNAGSALSGFNDKDLYISGNGRLNVTGKDRGINVMKNLTIQSGEVIAVAPKEVSGTIVIGINCVGSLNMTDGTVTARGIQGGISASEDIIISGGTVDASAESTGIICTSYNNPKPHIIISGGTVNAIGETGIRSSNVDITGGTTTAKGTIKALDEAPTTLKDVTAFASKTADDEEIETYKSDSNSSYKWFIATKDPIYLSPSTHTFATQIEGYESAPDAVTVTVTNGGTEATGDLNVVLTGSNSESFELSKTTINSIAAVTNNTDTFTITPKTGLKAGTYKATVNVSSDGKVSSNSVEVSFTVKEPSEPAGGSYYIPSVPAIDVSDQQGGNTGGKAAYDNLTNKITITPDEGYQIKDVTVNGKSMGPVDELTGIYGWDKVKVTFEKKESAKTPEQLAAEKNAKLTTGVKETRIIYLSASQLENGKVKLTYKKTKGYALDYYQIYRSAKKTSGFKKAFQTKNRYFITGKDLAQGKTLFFKVRGARKIGDKLVFTQFSRVESIKIK